MKMIGKTLLTTAIVAFVACNLFAGPLLQIPNNRFKMGAIPQNVSVSHHFWFKSIGTDTVLIDKIKTGCGCTMMPLEQNWIAPGDSMKVDICWDTKRTMGPTGSYPYIFLSGENGGVARVFITGTIIKYPDSLRPVSLTPYIFDVSTFGDQSKDSLEFSVRNHSDEDLTLTALSMDVYQCDIFLPASVPAGGVVKGYIKVKPEYLDKEFKRSFTILLNNKDNTRITIPVRRKIY